MIILYISLIIISFATIMVIKNNVTSEQRCKIIDAIFAYQCKYHDEHGKKDSSVWFDDMCSYRRTLWRLHDWGHKHIIPADKFEKIKSYIK